ncbi:MAG: sigma-70 family RNA polymerase sigma factor [Bdellovibrionota bacterium]|nr:sigma-70 family RNA polymerase sigma factor [Bdellovibrionota bacterium]
MGSRDKENWFQTTVVSLESPLLNYTYKILSRLAPSEEVVQESFFRLWKQEFPGNFEHYPKAWLYKVCRNLALDILKKEKRMDLEGSLDEILFSPCVSETLLESSLIMQEVVKLTVQQQEVLVLKFKDELSYKEIAELTGLSVSHVGVLLHEALGALREVILADLKRLEPETRL